MSTFRQKIQATTNWVQPAPEDLEVAPRKGRRSARRKGAPVTAHRLFPAFAAVWFGALFGLGSFTIPSSLLGALVMKTGLPALVPAATPPLGFTAHLLVALLLTGFGAALGLALALHLSPRGAAKAAPADAAIVVAAEPLADEAYTVRARDAHPDAPPRRPLVLTEAFVDPLVDEPETAMPLLRRKPGLPAGEPAGDPGPWIPEFTPGGAGVVRPLDLAALDLAETLEAPDVAEHPPEAPNKAVSTPAEPEREEQPALRTAPEATYPAQADASAVPALIAATPQLPPGFSAATQGVSNGTWSPVAGAPLESLGLVQLVERLALAIAAQKASNAAVIEAEAAMQAGSAPELQPAFEPEFEPGPFSRRQGGSPVPDVATTVDVPPVSSARETILHRLGALASGEPVINPDSPDAALLSFARPASAASAVRSQEPSEAVVPLWPAQAGTATFAPPAPPATSIGPETDEALRSALATLQRMTARG